MSHHDRAVLRTFSGVLAVLAILAFVFYFVASAVTGVDGNPGVNPNMESKIQENIAPVAKVAVAEAAAEGGAASAPRAGSEVYASYCMACHDSGVAGAPKKGDTGAWNPRAAKGLDGLLATATSGINAMPPKGTCADCSDEELKSAIAFLLKESGIEVAGGESAPAPAAAPAAAAPAASAKGQEVYQASCFACHGTGAAGAPKVGDAAAWAPRIDKGMDTLMNHAINGFNAMPPKGTCFSCSDADLQAAVEFMVKESR